MTVTDRFHPQYVTDADGRQTGVILPIEEYSELLEDLDDLAAAAERIAEPSVPHAAVLAELKEDGYISD